MGIPEILIILVVIVLLFGSRKLPELMKGMGQGLREFRNEVKDDAPHASKTDPTEVHTIPAGTTVISTKEPVPTDTASSDRR